MAGQHHVALLDRQLLAGGDLQLLGHQVDAGDHFGNRMFHLDAGVHFDEVEAAVLVQELERAGTTVADAYAGFGADLADLLALLGSDARCRRFFHHLLVAALHRAVALTQVDGVALAVGQHLDLHVARILQELLHVDLAIAERGLGLALGGFDRGLQRGFGVHHAHAAATATTGRLDDDRVADLTGDLGVGDDVFAQRAARAGHARHAGGLHRADGFDLVTHHADGVGLGADEDETGLFHALGEVGVLRQEAVARVDGLGVGDFRRGDQCRDVEVALRRRRRTDADRLVGHGHVLEVAVDRGVYGHRADAEGVARAQDAQRDFPSVGDDDFVEHGVPLSRSRTAAGRTPPAGRSRRGWRRWCRTCRLRSG